MKCDFRFILLLIRNFLLPVVMRKKITFHQAPNFVVHVEYIEVISKPRLTAFPLPQVSSSCAWRYRKCASTSWLLDSQGNIAISEVLRPKWWARRVRLVTLREKLPSAKSTVAQTSGNIIITELTLIICRSTDIIAVIKLMNYNNESYSIINKIILLQHSLSCSCT